MRTLVIGYGGDDSGHGRYCRAFVDALRDAGEDAVLHSLRGMPRYWLLGLWGVKQADRLTRTIANAAGSIRAIRAGDPRVVHFQLLTPVVDRWWIPFLSQNRIRVMTVHNVEPHRASVASAPSMLEAIYGAMDALIVHSQANRRRFEDLHPRLSKKVTVIPHGIWKVSKRVERQAARAALALAPDRPVILFFGVIRRNKGLDLLLRALDLLRGELSPLPYLVVAGQPAFGESFEPYGNLIKSLKLEDMVVTHLGYVPEEKLPIYYSAADTVALPYEQSFQAQSGILADAYAYGVPIVATDVGGIGETVRADGTGVVVDRREPQAFASALRHLLSNPAVRDAASKRMRALAEGAYSWGAVGARTRDLYVMLEELRSRPRTSSTQDERAGADA